jgi:putative SOS response-associated peptidase YedK
LCGRFTLLDLADFVAMFPWVVPPEQFAPRYNIAPTQPILMLSNRGGGTLDHAIWGFIPNWSKGGPDASKALINARCETISHKPAFRTSLRYKRCIVPASGFYEWQQKPGGKQPYYITQADHKPMLMAGLWEDSHDGSGGEIRTACVITTPPNSFMREIHDRMPVILRVEQIEPWLTGVMTPEDIEKMEFDVSVNPCDEGNTEGQISLF